MTVARVHEGDDWHIDVVAAVELRLETCDAKIPFTLPWLDRIERRAASPIGLEKTKPKLEIFSLTLAIYVLMRTTAPKVSVGL